MNHFIPWCFRVGVVCFLAFTIISAPIAFEIFTMSHRSLAGIESVMAALGFTFMLLGLVLLVDAIRRLRVQWADLSAFGKFISVVGLLMTQFFGGYIYYYFFTRHFIKGVGLKRSH